MPTDSVPPVVPAPTEPAMAKAAPPSGGAPGIVLAGKYKLVREIGRGGMGVVWMAERLDWAGAPVAVKLITPLALAPERFALEAITAAFLRGQDVVQVLDHGVDTNTGVLFIVMELLAGESLGTRLRNEKRLSAGDVLQLVRQLGSALSRFHRAGVVHRDLKPDNIFLVDTSRDLGTSSDGRLVIKILDFGLARALNDGSRLDSAAVTMLGRPVGTPWYMSPERLNGASDPLADLWSVAVIAFECLVGRRPFDASMLAALQQQVCGADRPVPSRIFADVPPGFDAWFARATHPHIERRYQTAEELVDALREVCGSRRSAPHVEPQRPPKQAIRLAAEKPAPMPRARFNRAALAYGVGGGCAIAIGCLFALSHWAPSHAGVVPERPTTGVPQALTPAPAVMAEPGRARAAPEPRTGGPSAPQTGASPGVDVPPAATTVSAVPQLTSMPSSEVAPVATSARRPSPRKKVPRPRAPSERTRPEPDDRQSPTPNEDF